MGIKILIVDRDEDFVKGLRYSFEQDDYIVESISSGKDILDKIEGGKYDLILLELILPNINGLDLCRSIRENFDTPIIIITRQDEDISKILALEYGADDYLVKPFNILELKARIKAILRRIPPSNEKSNGLEVVEIGDFKINTVGRKVRVHNREINLTGKEFDLLYVLISNPGKIFTRKDLIDLVWGYAYYGDFRTVDVHIRRIRQKIEKDPGNTEYIFTKWGVGYYYRDARL